MTCSLWHDEPKLYGQGSVNVVTKRLRRMKTSKDKTAGHITPRLSAGQRMISGAVAARKHDTIHHMSQAKDLLNTEESWVLSHLSWHWQPEWKQSNDKQRQVHGSVLGRLPSHDHGHFSFETFRRGAREAEVKTMDINEEANKNWLWILWLWLWMNNEWRKLIWITV